MINKMSYLLFYCNLIIRSNTCQLIGTQMYILIVLKINWLDYSVIGDKYPFTPLGYTMFLINLTTFDL